MLLISLLDQESGGFIVEERQNEDYAGKYNVKRGWNDPRVIARLVDVEAAAPGGKVCKLCGALVGQA